MSLYYIPTPKTLLQHSFQKQLEKFWQVHLLIWQARNTLLLILKCQGSQRNNVRTKTKTITEYLRKRREGKKETQQYPGEREEGLN